MQAAPTAAHSLVTKRRFLSLAGVVAIGASLFLAPSAPARAAAAERGKVLAVMSAAHELELKDGKKYQTGYYLDELSIPARKLLAAGFTLVFASPAGKAPTFDPKSNDKMFFGNSDSARADALKFVTENQQLAHPNKLSDIVAQGTADYVAVFIPGGHAPMQDLVDNRDLGKILVSFHATGRATGVICHGPSALLSALPDPSAFRKAMAAGDFMAANKVAAGWPYAGYRLTVFSSKEERLLEGAQQQLGGFVQFHASDALSEAGAHVDSVAAFHPNVIVDRELVSGQQPFSSSAFGDAFLARIQAFSTRK